MYALMVRRWPLFLMLLLMNLSHPAAAPGQPLDTTAVDRFVLAQMRAHRIPGVALAITEGDTVRYVQGYGSTRADTPVTPRTQFRVGSLSKSFTALAVLQLVEAGRVDLDAPVQRYLADFTLANPDAAARITVRQLLNQVSGLADAGVADLLGANQRTLAARLGSLRDARPVAPAGSAFHYSDPNYQILARLVEVVSGQPFDSYLQGRLFSPLEMPDTFGALTSDEATTRAEHLAQGHIVVYGQPVAVEELSGFLGGSGGVVSTAADMAHYLAMQAGGGQYKGRALVTPEHLVLTHTPPPGGVSQYGMGWFALEEHGRRTIQHNGVLSTAYAEAVLLPECGYGFVLLYDEYSLASAALAFPTLKAGLIALLEGETPPEGGLTVPVLGGIFALITLVSAGLGLRSLVRLPAWAARAVGRARWRQWLGVLGSLTPALLLLALPRLLAASSDRSFGFVMLARAMPEIIIPLAAVSTLGAITAVRRLFFVVWRHG